MQSKGPVWCAKCYLRVAPYAPQTVYRGNKYHPNCLLKLVREEASQEKAVRLEARAAGVGQGRPGLKMPR
jgi:hypothetical protein